MTVVTGRVDNAKDESARRHSKGGEGSCELDYVRQQNWFIIDDSSILTDLTDSYELVSVRSLQACDISVLVSIFPRAMLLLYAAP